MVKSYEIIIKQALKRGMWGFVLKCLFFSWGRSVITKRFYKKKKFKEILWKAMEGVQKNLKKFFDGRHLWTFWIFLPHSHSFYNHHVIKKLQHASIHVKKFYYLHRVCASFAPSGFNVKIFSSLRIQIVDESLKMQNYLHTWSA